jgi:hypothetical protein
MVRTCRGELRPNGPGLDLYLKEKLVQYGELPFEGGDEYTAVSFPDEAVVLVPDDVHDDLPIKLEITEADLE